MTRYGRRRPGKMKRLFQRLIAPIHRKLSLFLETPTPDVEVLPESLWLANSREPERQHATFYDQPMAHSYEDGYDNNQSRAHHRPGAAVHPASRSQSRTLVQSRTSTDGNLRLLFSRGARPATHQAEQGGASGIVDRRPRRQSEQRSDVPLLHENSQVAFCRSDSRGGIVIRSLLSFGSVREPDALRTSNSIVGMMEDQRHAAKEMKEMITPFRAERRHAPVVLVEQEVSSQYEHPCVPEAVPAPLLKHNPVDK